MSNKEQKVALNPCPCGVTPSRLYISDAGQGGKWANVSGDCCGQWTIEFRTEYNDLNSPKCMKLAIEGWNEAPISSTDDASRQSVLAEEESVATKEKVWTPMDTIVSKYEALQKENRELDAINHHLRELYNKTCAEIKAKDKQIADLESYLREYNPFYGRTAPSDL